MRPASAALLLAVLLVPASAAQLPPPTLLIEAAATPTEPLQAGNSTSVTFSFTRLCPNSAVVLGAQTLDTQVIIEDGANWTLSGPTQGMFTQQACATQMRQTIDLTYTLHLSAGAAQPEAHVDSFTVRARAAPGDQATPATREAMYGFTLATAAAPVPVIQAPVRESPGLGLAGALLAVALLAVALARRR